MARGAVQGIGAKFIDRIEGDFLNVAGLPMEGLKEQLKQIGGSI